MPGTVLRLYPYRDFADRINTLRHRVNGKFQQCVRRLDDGVNSLECGIYGTGADGRLLLAFGGPGTGAGEFSLPTGMFLDPDGVIWVADSFNQRVQAFRLLGGD